MKVFVFEILMADDSVVRRYGQFKNRADAFEWGITITEEYENSSKLSVYELRGNGNLLDPYLIGHYYAILG